MQLTPSSSRFNSMLAAARRSNQDGVYDIHTNLMMYPASTQPTHARIEQVVDEDNGENTELLTSTKFPPLNPAVSRNFLVTDMHLETPPTGISAASYELSFRNSPTDQAASAGADFLAPFKGLRAVPQEIRDLLPEDCRKHFDVAVKAEDDWHAKWGNEAQTTCRREPVVDKAIVPYSMMLS
jgi:chromatin structure-remodeling complex protein RSC7